MKEKRTSEGVSSWRDEAWKFYSNSTRWIFVSASGTFPQCKAKEIEGRSDELIVKGSESFLFHEEEGTYVARMS
eukprot:scaffold5219_cov148-Skeletonema_dohrnii-CCMP3373.AAC.4